MSLQLPPDHELPGIPRLGGQERGTHTDGGEPAALGAGWGGSRREAEQQAARQALERLPSA